MVATKMASHHPLPFIYYTIALRNNVKVPILPRRECNFHSILLYGIENVSKIDGDRITPGYHFVTLSL